MKYKAKQNDKKTTKEKPTKPKKKRGKPKQRKVKQNTCRRKNEGKSKRCSQIHAVRQIKAVCVNLRVCLKYFVVRYLSVYLSVCTSPTGSSSKSSVSNKLTFCLGLLVLFIIQYFSFTRSCTSNVISSLFVNLMHFCLGSLCGIVVTHTQIHTIRAVT